MSVATNPRLAAMAPSAVYVKESASLSNEDAAAFLKSYIASSEDMIHVAANTSLNISSAAASSAVVDAMAAEMAQNERIVAQLKRVETTLHSYSHTSYDYTTTSTFSSNDQTEQTEEAAADASDKPISKEERKRLKKERKKNLRKEKQTKNEDDDEEEE